jgi:predicted XRE-type DNA-binding protein
MNNETQKALEAAGFIVGDAEDFLELNAEERAIVELRVRLSRAVRELRGTQNLTQTDLAHKMKTSQPRVNRIEAASPDVSLEQLFRSWYALGGTVEMKLEEHTSDRVDALLVGQSDGKRTGKQKKSIVPKTVPRPK